MRVFFMGTPDFAEVSLKALLDGGFEVTGVFTQPDKPVGRKQVLTPPPVKVLALAHDIPVYQPLKLRDGTAAGIIRDAAPDVLAVVAYGRILPAEILAIPPMGCVNIHGSLLPRYRGAAPIQWAVINGDAETGVTAQFMAEAMDAGDIIGVRKTPILPGETAGELFDRLAPMGAELLCETLRKLEAGDVRPVPQDPGEVTYAPPLTKELAEIDFNRPGRLVVSHILGMDPWPVASAAIAGTHFRIYRAYCNGKRTEAAPGTVLSAGKEGIEVAVSDGSVTITELQAPGGRRMAAADYLRGHPLCL